MNWLVKVPGKPCADTSRETMLGGKTIVDPRQRRANGQGGRNFGLRIGRVVDV